MAKCLRVRWHLQDLNERFRAFTERNPTQLYEQITPNDDGETADYSFFAGEVDLTP